MNIQNAANGTSPKTTRTNTDFKDMDFIINLYRQLEKASNESKPILGSDSEIEHILFSDDAPTEPGDTLKKMCQLYKSFAIKNESNKFEENAFSSLRQDFEKNSKKIDRGLSASYISLNQFLTGYYLNSEYSRNDFWEKRLGENKDNNKIVLKQWNEIIKNYKSKNYPQILPFWKDFLILIEEVGKKDILYTTKHFQEVSDHLQNMELTIKIKDIKNKLFKIIDSILGKNAHSKLSSKEGCDYKLQENNCYFLAELLYGFDSPDSKAIRKKKYHEVSIEYLQWLKDGFMDLAYNEDNQLTAEYVEERWENTFSFTEIQLSNDIDWLIEKGTELSNILQNEHRPDLLKCPQEIEECKDAIYFLITKINILRDERLYKSKQEK